jgi:serine/threonine-protein kinase
MMIGQTLSHFKITAKLGEGGMGEVYRAEDTKLGREVAIKVLPKAFTEDPERFARFQREAHVLASLNHPNIAAIYDLAEDQGIHFLVLELAEGEDLATRLSPGPIAVADALPLALQIAEAMEAAHEKGIVHRDLKPANVMVDPDDKIKVLDFGLAKAREVEPGESDSLSMSPTLTAQMTQAGTILGTAAYMSPEQARGQEVDEQTDIWALGVVLYEMLTGERTFSGDTATDTIAAVIERDPDWDALPSATPPLVRSLLRRCLQKDRRHRLHDVADARVELEEALQEPAYSAPAPEEQIGGRFSVWTVRPWLVAGGLLIALLTGWIIRGFGRSEIPQPKAHLSIELSGSSMLDYTYRYSSSIAISPDGQTVVWAADGSDGVRRLYSRRLDQLEVRPIPGTENGDGPFFSPDGRWIAYFDGQEGQLKKVTVAGGMPIRICDVPGSRGGTWSTRDEIVFPRDYDSGLSRVSANGGTPEILTETDREAGIKTHRHPHFLPNGRAVLFMVAHKDTATYSDSRIEALDLGSGKRTILVEGGMSPRYTESGHLVFARQGTLMAVSLDPDTLKVRGQPKQVFDGVVTHESQGFAEFAIAANGTLLYAPGGPETFSERVVQADRLGRLEPLSLPEQPYGTSYAFSPDGRTLAITVSGANFNIWLWDLERSVFSRLTRGGGNSQVPTWTPDGKALVFKTDRRASGASDFYWVPADSSQPSRPIYESQRTAWPGSWTPDGQQLVYYEHDPETDYDIWALPIGENLKPGEPRPVVVSPAKETYAATSPDGRWLAYASDESGMLEIYIQSFPGPGPRKQVSSGGGTWPKWGPRGEEIFYVEPVSRQLMAASVRSEPELTIGAPEALFPFEATSNAFAVTPDGEHFVFTQRGSQAQPITQLRIVFNWLDELDRILTDTGGR